MTQHIHQRLKTPVHPSWNYAYPRPRTLYSFWTCYLLASTVAFEWYSSRSPIAATDLQPATPNNDPLSLDCLSTSASFFKHASASSVAHLLRPPNGVRAASHAYLTTRSLPASRTLTIWRLPDLGAASWGLLAICSRSYCRFLANILSTISEHHERISVSYFIAFSVVRLSM